MKYLYLSTALVLLVILLYKFVFTGLLLVGAVLLIFIVCRNAVKKRILKKTIREEERVWKM